MRSRLTVAAVIFALWAVGIETRLVFLQVLEHDELVDRAERQQLQTRTLAAKRGDIVDRKGRILATSVDADTGASLRFACTTPARPHISASLRRRRRTAAPRPTRPHALCRRRSSIRIPRRPPRCRSVCRASSSACRCP